MVMTLEKKLLHRADYRLRERNPVEQRRQEVSELMRPLRDDWEDDREGRQRGVRSYDSTAAIALDQAGMSISSMMTASDNIWAPLEFDNRALNENPDVRAWLAAVNHIVFASLDPSVDKFYNDAPEVVLDAIGIGDGALFSTRYPGSDRFHTMAIPWRQYTFAVGNYGEVTHFDRWYEEPWFNIMEMFPDYEFSDTHKKEADEEPNKKKKLLHTVVPNEGYNQISASHRFASVYYLRDGDLPISWGGYRDMPYNVCRWGVGSGETYGIGRGVFALPDAQMLNEMNRTTITAAQMAAEPPPLASDELEGLVSLDHHNLNFGALDENGNPLVKPYQSGANFTISLEMMDQRRSQIQDLFYHAIMSLVGSPTPSTVEVLENAAQRDKSMGPHLARIISEFYAPFILTRFRELERAGRIPPAPQVAAGQSMKVRFVSPLAKAHRASKATATLNYARGIAELMQIDPNARFKMNASAAADALADGLAAPDGVVVPNDKAQEMIAAEMEQQQAAQQLAALEQGGRGVESLARAGEAAARAEQPQ